MRFKEFLSESNDFDLEKFKVDCRFYLEQMNGINNFLFHGTKRSPTDFKIGIFKEREGPRDSPHGLHAGVNSVFQKNFGFPFRNGLFTTSCKSDARVYGELNVIFPIGKFEWLCNTGSDFTDLTLMLGHSDLVPGMKLMDPARVDIANANLIEIVEKSKDWLHNTDLVKCVESENEIMLKCDKYYSFNFIQDTFQDVVAPFIKAQ
jgi:hypothetical protein